MSDPFWDEGLRDWFFSCFEDPELVIELPVLLEGNGPFEPKELEQFLVRHGLDGEQLAEAEEARPVIIVGREDWSEELLSGLVQARQGEHLWVYSQEMFLAFMITGSDPFELPIESLEAFAVGHPAIKYLRNLDFGFNWPSSSVEPSTEPLQQGQTEAWPEIGLLRYLGYRTGRTGIQSDRDRRDILLRAFEFDTRGTPFEGGWATPRSAGRLEKMANVLNSLSENAKRKSRPPSAAIAHWDGDLEWLKKNLYDRKFRFQWPGGSVSN